MNKVLRKARRFYQLKVTNERNFLKTETKLTPKWINYEELTKNMISEMKNADVLSMTGYKYYTT